MVPICYSQGLSETGGTLMIFNCTFIIPDQHKITDDGAPFEFKRNESGEISEIIIQEQYAFKKK